MTLQNSSTAPFDADLRGRHVRDLLRALRDLDLAQRVTIRTGHVVRVEGCSSRDEPVERGVRYRLSHDGVAARLLMRGENDAVVITLEDPRCPRELHCELHLDEEGRATAPLLSARFDTGAPSSRAASHFLRRVLRTCYAPDEAA